MSKKIYQVDILCSGVYYSNMQCRYCEFETENHLEIGDHHIEEHKNKPFNPAWYDDEYDQDTKIQSLA